MSDYCVFCGKETHSRLACHECRHHIDDLTPDQRKVFEAAEEDEKARETLHFACMNLRLSITDLLEAFAEIFRQFGKKDG